ncbi:hypothetical protein NicSoilB8_16820 [Arthrobacter sp. NicSoilB8]|nr:hypothetical protein NicSoilB8_16820 [Arthrobacter sp. NicSoilB8]
MASDSERLIQPKEREGCGSSEGAGRIRRVAADPAGTAAGKPQGDPAGRLLSGVVRGNELQRH